MNAQSIPEFEVTAGTPQIVAPVRILPPRASARRYVGCLGVGTVLFGLVLMLQWLGGAYRNEFAGYPDEGAHYITGLMVRDYVAAHRLISFRQFAENYYLHYPKVAIGHWPPFFYVVQAAWTLVFPVSRPSLLVLMALITAVFGFLLYRAVEDELGTALGISAGLLLVSIPVVQSYSGMVMADTLVGLLSFAAVLCFAKFVDNSEWKYAAWFGVMASATILTKGTGLALALVPPLVLLFTGRWSFLRRWAFWLPIAIVVPLCAPWYWLTRNMLPNTWEQPEPGFGYVLHAIRFYSRHSLHVMSLVLLVLAAVGFLVELFMRPRKEVKSVWAAFAALLISTILVAVVVPAGLEERFLIPAIPAITAFAIAALAFLANHALPQHLGVQTRRLALLLPVALIFLLLNFFVPRDVSYGFAPVANYVLSQPDLQKAVLLISSDVTGDSMFISELAMRERRPGHYVLRGTKVLCDCSWLGDQQRALYPTPQALMTYLDHSPVQIVIDDESVPARSRLQFRHVLDDAIKAYPEQWKLLGAYPIVRDGVSYPKGVNVYRVVGTDPDAPVKIDLHRMLHETIQLRPH